MADPRNEGPIPLPAGRNRQPAPSRSEGADAAVALPVGLRPPGSGRVGAADYSTAPLTEPDMRARIRLLGSISDRQRELVSDPWGIQFVPARLE
jgi:hypothetical protein